MMAFFDSLIQREIENWDSPSEFSGSDSDEDHVSVSKRLQDGVHFSGSLVYRFVEFLKICRNPLGDFGQECLINMG